jgi:hypothetical protein
MASDEDFAPPHRNRGRNRGLAKGLRQCVVRVFAQISPAASDMRTEGDLFLTWCCDVGGCCQGFRTSPTEGPHAHRLPHTGVACPARLHTVAQCPGLAPLAQKTGAAAEALRIGGAGSASRAIRCGGLVVGLRRSAYGAYLAGADMAGVAASGCVRRVRRVPRLLRVGHTCTSGIPDHLLSVRMGTPVRAAGAPRILSGHADPRRRPPAGGPQALNTAR